jgi:hypothetical protein
MEMKLLNDETRVSTFEILIYTDFVFIGVSNILTISNFESYIKFTEMKYNNYIKTIKIVMIKIAFSSISQL